MTIHQIWLGDVLPEQEQEYAANIKSAAEKSGISYKLWSLKDIKEKYGKEEPFFFFKHIFFKHPYPHLLKVAVDYYKWRILADTPADDKALYLDASVEVQVDKLREFTLPRRRVTVGMDHGGMFGFIFTEGNTIAAAITKDMELAIQRYFDIYDPEFERQLLETYRPYGPKTGVHMGADWCLRWFETHNVKLGHAAHKWYALAIRPERPLFIRHTLSVRKSKDQLVALHDEAIKYYESNHTQKQPSLWILMSSAAGYHISSRRTLGGLIETSALRDIQRGIHSAQESGYISDRLFFVVEDEGVEKNDTDCVYIKDAVGAEYKGLKMYKAIEWANEVAEPGFIFVCSDDTFIHLPRLLDYCKHHRPGETKIMASMNEEGIPQVGGGMLLPTAAYRQLVIQGKAPKQNEPLGAFVKRVAADAGIEIQEEGRFSYFKANYPSKKNRFITTHKVNPYDLLYLLEDNLN